MFFVNKISFLCFITPKDVASVLRKAATSVSFSGAENVFCSFFRVFK